MRVLRVDVLLQKLRERAEELGASLLWRHSLWKILDGHTAVVKGPDGKILSIDADVIIGADGLYSMVRTMVREERGFRWLPVLQASLRIENWYTDEVGLFFERQHPTGFGWVVPCENFASIGVCGPCKEEDETPQRFKSLLLSLAAMGHLSGNIRCEPSMKMIPVYQQGRLVRDSLVVAGTAAGQVHPISGAGMACRSWRRDGWPLGSQGRRRRAHGHSAQLRRGMGSRPWQCVAQRLKTAPSLGGPQVPSARGR